MKICAGSAADHSAFVALLNAACGQDSNKFLTDYGGVISCGFKGDIYIPDSNEECYRLLSSVDSSDLLTYRGSGHSMHGRSIPSTRNRLLVTSSLRQVHFQEPGLITVQAGVQIGVLEEFLNRLGWHLPVLPDAIKAGPTVAGYFLAGGFGSRSEEYGGFWENVDSLICCHPSHSPPTRVHHTDDLFWELSGSGGSLDCFISELNLIIKPLDVSRIYPVGFTASLPTLQSDTTKNIVWFTLFVPLTDQKQLFRKYKSVLSDLSKVLHLVSPRRARIRFLTRYPLFLSEFSVDLLAFSVGGIFRNGSVQCAATACQIVRDLADSVPTSVQYHPSELVLEDLRARAHVY
ncbi:FAD-binding protein [Vulcanococcus sp. Clear-D1]|uniref:FAD-binding protein n=1 Tax=Vulcanococcus sp. Clear-D1 TaxID=2766970 RepID=UPI0019ADFD71|nr:FAD-binding protein [Vulcanococcus sp. Clear-D1]MBD1194581.1 FAD-binding protein [Vulcanococcus sp. Clear-D1]